MLRLRTNCVELVLLRSRSVKNETDLENILEKRLLVGVFLRQGDVLNEVHHEAQAPYMCTRSRTTSVRQVAHTLGQPLAHTPLEGSGPYPLVAKIL